MTLGSQHNKNSFDVLIVSGARPELLKVTLDSFEKNLFSNIEINDCYINIDPFEGGIEQVKTCEIICRGYFKNVYVNKPTSPHFTKAVQWLWSKPQTEWALSIEDDWILSRKVEKNEIISAMKSGVTQISFMTKEKMWKFRSNYHYKPKRRKVFGIDIGRTLDRRRPIFTTSPSFINSTFAKRCSQLMVHDLDPEKQLNKINETLSEYTSPYRNHFIGSRNDHVAVDIGRDHRAAKGIIKKVIDGQSFWQTYST